MNQTVRGSAGKRRRGRRVGCQRGGQEGGLPEGEGQEGSLPEGEGQEGSLSEGEGQEGSLPEGEGQEGSLPEGEGLARGGGAYYWPHDHQLK